MIKTTIVDYPERGNYGSNKYRGNCSGKLIKDIIETPLYGILDKNGNAVQTLSDYMVGSGTTEDVCREMGVHGTFLDLNRGFDMMTMDIPDHPDNIFWHPPYAGMIVYSDNMYKAEDIINKYGFDPRTNDLSRAKNYDDFMDKTNYCAIKQFCSLAKGGRMFILVGDWKQQGRIYSMFCDMVKLGTLEQIIIKTENNCVSSNRRYSNPNIIYTMHEYLIVLRKDSAIIIPAAYVKRMNIDVRDCKIPSWRTIITSVLEEYGPMKATQITEIIKDSYKAKCATNKDVCAKVRQILRMPYFKNIGNATYAVA